MRNTADTEQTAKHTPEPWFVQPSDHPDGLLIKPIPGQVVAQCDQVPEMQANAHRICATVNACKDISTEALERGIVAELRHLLSELISAAGDLDAAIDGATCQFDAERNRLNAALRAAQPVLHSGMALDLHELLANRGRIALIWSIKDVQEIRPGLSDEQAWKVLDRVEHKHDATLGVTWDTLETVADDLFGDAPETDSPE